VRKILALAVIVLGVFLVVRGLASSDSLGSRLSQVFSGSRPDSSLWLVLCGALAVVAGVSLAWYRGGRRA
jgi:drug/metabolite transporter (DMT)-like permease